MSEVSITDWQINDIAIYTPKKPNSKTAFITGRRYIVQDILHCECGCVMLVFLRIKGLFIYLMIWAIVLIFL